MPLAPGTHALEPAALDAAFDRAVALTGRPPRALLLTNPHNPLGRSMPRAELDAVARWCARREVHLVSDEIYALSLFGGPAEAGAGAGAGPGGFTSLGGDRTQ